MNNDFINSSVAHTSAIDTPADNTLTTVYKDHHTWLHGWLRKKVHCSHQASDLSQDTFLNLLLLQNKSGALPEFKQPRAYLTKVAGRLVYHYFRRKTLEKNYLEALAHLPEQTRPSLAEQLIVQESLAELDAIFDQMKPAVRTAFLLSQLEGLSYAEIALQLAVSERTVKRYMAQAFEECIIAMS